MKSGPRHRPRIAALDGIRALSILLVVFGHAAATATSSFARQALSACGDAEVGVSAFFVLSGYLITALLLDELDRTERISLRDFYWRRAFRILPPFILLLTTLFLLRAGGVIAFRISELVAAALFIWNYAPWTGNWWLGHTWSLSVEEQFYLCWPGVLRLLGRVRARRVALGLIAVAPFVRLASYALFPSLRGRIPIMMHTRIDTLMFGCWLALLRADNAIPKFGRAFRRCLPWLAIVVLTLHSVLAKRFGGRYLLTGGLTIEGASLAGFVFSVLEDPTSLIARALSHPAVTWLGRLSYSLYLWQQLFLTPANPTLSGQWPLNLLAAMAAAAASYYFVEQPALRLGRRLRDKPTASPT